MSSDSIKRLSVTYDSIIAVISAMFIVLVLGLVALDFRNQRDRAIKQIRQQLDDRTHTVDQFLQKSEQDFALFARSAHDIYQKKEGVTRPRFLQDDPQGRSFDRNAVPKDSQWNHGAIFGLGPLDALSPAAQRELMILDELSDFHHLAQRGERLSFSCFYLSKKNMLALYPWRSKGALLQQKKKPTLESFLKDRYQSKLWTQMLPAKNPERRMRWSVGCQKNSSLGLHVMVHGPIYNKDEFLGVVGIKRPLKTLSSLLTHYETQKGSLFLIDARGNVLSTWTSKGATTPQTLASLDHSLPERPQTGQVVRSFREPTFTEHQGYYYFTTPLQNAPWVMVYAIAQRDVYLQFWPSFAGHMGLILGLVAFLVIANLLVRRLIVSPAILLVRHIHEETQTGSASIPKVPGAWRPWFEMISDTLPIRAMAANVPGAVYQMVRRNDGKLRFRFISSGIEDLLGVKPDELTLESYNPLLLFEPSDVPGVLSAMDVSAETQGGFEYEATLRTDFGGKKWVRLMAKPRQPEGGDLVWDGLMLDITDQKRMEEWRGRLASLVESSEDAIVSITIEGIVMTWNAGAQRMYGYPASEMLGKNISMLFSPADIATLSAASEHACAGQRVDRFDAVSDTRSGETIHASISVSSIRDPHGAVLGISLILRNSTKRYLAEAALNRRDAILNAISDGAERFLRTSGWQEHVESVLAMLGQAAETSRAYLFKNYREKGQWGMIGQHEWVAEGIASKIHTPEMEQRPYRQGLTRWETQLQRGLTIAGRVDALPACERDVLHRSQVQSLLVVPIFAGSDWWGFIGFDECGYPRDWSDVEINALRTAAGVLGAAIRRKETETALQLARLQEVNIGSRIQQTLLLGKIPPNIQGAELAKMTISSEKIDGDFVDFVRHDTKHFDLMVGDVMGKGVPAALLGAATKSVFSQAISNIVCAANVASLPTPEEIVNFAHSQLCEQLIALYSFATICYARFDLAKMRMDMVDGGHTQTIHYRAKTGRCDLIKSNNLPLGFSETEQYRQISVDLEPDDLLLFYSDGLIEARNRAREYYGIERLVHYIEDHHRLPPEALLKELYSELTFYANTVNFSDDMTCVAVKIHEIPVHTLLNSNELKMTSTPSDLASLRVFLRTLISETEGLADDLGHQLELAVNEVASNIMRHGYHGQDGQPIEVESEIYDDRIEIRLFHWGKPMETLQMTSPAFDGRQDHGFGLYLIRNCVDEVNYTTEPDGKSCVALVKYIKKG